MGLRARRPMLKDCARTRRAGCAIALSPAPMSAAVASMAASAGSCIKEPATAELRKVRGCEARGWEAWLRRCGATPGRLPYSAGPEAPPSTAAEEEEAPRG